MREYFVKHLVYSIILHFLLCSFLQRSGSAFECGGLRVGHLILEVDGINMARRPHHEVAQLIARAFYATHGTDQVEFLVAETARNPEQEIRRASILVFD